MNARKIWRWARWAAAGAVLSGTTAGCGPQYVLLHPAGPVAASELHLMVLAGVAMAVVIVFVYVLLAVALLRYRAGRGGDYRPEWDGDRRLEILWFLIPVAIVTLIAIPTVQQTFRLADPPAKSADPLVIDVTSLSWKWLFEYPGQHIATVNYLVIPTGRRVLFELTADSAMNTFWVPRLGGMEYTMPDQVLPLWLEASRPGVYWGHSGNFSGPGFETMFFTVKAVSPEAFQAWAARTAQTAPAMTLVDYRHLLAQDVVGRETFGRYPMSTFPAVPTGFTLTGDGMYTLMKPHMPMGGSSAR
jgi:cytochrome aa3-600 menaquinol oxidase subunit 2